MTTELAQEVGAGRELDALVGRALQIEPAVTWHTFNAEGDATLTFDDEAAARHFVDRHGLVNGYVVGSRERWPRFSEDMRAAWEVVARVSAKTKWYELSYRPQAALANFTGNQGDEARAFLDECGGSREKAQALAICRAALKAIAPQQAGAPGDLLN